MNRPPKSTKPHRGVDFNYNVPGQSGINLTHPALHSPVDGIVTNAGQGRYGRIAIRDKDGNIHEILHTDKQIRFLSTNALETRESPPRAILVRLPQHSVDTGNQQRPLVQHQPGKAACSAC